MGIRRQTLIPAANTGRFERRCGTKEVATEVADHK
jgi:hypothetical protein